MGLTRRSLKCLLLNARSVINKFDVFEATVASIDPDIIGVTESWSNNSILDSELMLSGYEMFRCDRATNNMGEAFCSTSEVF